VSRTVSRDVPLAASRVLPGLQAEAAHALNALMLMQQAGGKPLRHAELEPVRLAIAGMADYLSPVLGEDLDIGGVNSLGGYQYAHPAGVAALSMAIGVCLGFEKGETGALGMSAVLMNIGYALLRPSLLEQSSQLEDDRWVEVKTHAAKSAEMLENCGLDAAVIAAIDHHHERWDGSGYHQGLAGRDIPRWARIIGIADTYVSLRSPRPHRRAMGPRTATDFVISGCGVLFDPELVQVFARRLPHLAIGSPIVLSSGEAGIVVNPNIGHVCRPIVRVSSMNGVALSDSYEIDMTDREQLSVVVREDSV